jgi:hypothetical protein
MSGKDTHRGGVSFSSTLMGIIGIIAGMAICLGVPALILIFGTTLQLTSTATATVIIFALIMGGGISTVSAFFGIVIPNRVGGHHSMPRDAQHGHSTKK